MTAIVSVEEPVLPIGFRLTCTGMAQVKAVHTIFKEEKSNLFVMDNKHSKRVNS